MNARKMQSRSGMNWVTAGKRRSDISSSIRQPVVSAMSQFGCACARLDGATEIRGGDVENGAVDFDHHSIVQEAVMFMKTPLVAIVALTTLVCAAHRTRAQEFNAERHYSVSFLACDRSGRCERMKRPLDADNEIACMLKAGMVGAVEWLKERPGWKLSEMHCGADGEAYL